MKKVAICTPGFLPVPAIHGGAIEHLLTEILDINEVEKELQIDLYTIAADGLSDLSFSSTEIHQIKVNNFERLLCKILNKLYKIFKINMQADLFGRKVSKLLKNKEFDYVLIENNMYVYKTIVSKYKKNTRYLFHLHNDIGGSDKPYWLCRYISRTSEAVITCSKYLNYRFSNVTNFKNIQVLYNSIELNNFRYNVNARASLRERWGLQDKDFTFMYVGRISREKGLYELVNAFKKLAEYYENISLVVVGDASYNGFGINNYYKSIISLAEGCKAQIIFLGKQPNENIPSIMSAADCIVIPTITEEAFGMVAVEAMACQRPLIVTNSGGLVEVVDEKCALIADKNNIIDELFEKMQMICVDNSIVKNMGLNGYRRVKSIADFHIANYYMNFINILKSYE